MYVLVLKCMYLLITKNRLDSLTKVWNDTIQNKIRSLGDGGVENHRIPSKEHAVKPNKVCVGEYDGSLVREDRPPTPSAYSFGATIPN